MNAVYAILRVLLNADRKALSRGAALALLVPLMGAGLLGLSGWFIVATGVAGLTGVGIAFDVFRPSAGIRFLALGRAAARYGERVFTHDATLRALARLRVVLLRGFARGDARSLSRLRGESALTRIISDVDALDGVLLRLVLPVVSAVMAHGVAFVVLGWLVGWPVALAIALGYLPLGALILYRLARRTTGPSREAEEAVQALRRGVIDMIRDREALILSGQLASREARLMALDAVSRASARQLDRSERGAGAMLTVLGAVAAMAAFIAGAYLMDAGEIGPAKAVIGVFVALALAEVLSPLRRGFAELGRVAHAAQRIVPFLTVPSGERTGKVDPKGSLVEVNRPNLHFVAREAEALVITGPSGAGKSTLLMDIAGLGDGQGITVSGIAPSAWPDAGLRSAMAVLPQRSVLIAGTLRDNMSLTGEFSDDEIWSALKTVLMDDDIRARGGLDNTLLTEGGKGLSGGQARRLALARILLKKPAILLLDEPTEGLDEATANAVLQGLRQALPQAAIIAAMHRHSDHPIFHRRVHLAADHGDDVT